MKRYVHVLLAVFMIGLFSLASASDAAAAYNIFVKIEGVDGESKDQFHDRWIDALAISHQIEQIGSMHAGGGGGAGRANFGDIIISKRLDRASPHLNLLCALGQPLQEVVIDFVTAGRDKPIVFMQIILTDVVVSGIATSASQPDDQITEDVKLNFAKIQWIYTEIDPTGKTKGHQETGWDIRANTRF